MKYILVRLIVFVAFAFLNPDSSLGAESTLKYSGFIAKKDGKIIESSGQYSRRHAPFSTFKVPLAVMGFNEGILESEDLPKWPFREEYEKQFPNWYTREKGLEYHWCEDHTPATFMRYSVIWFSHQITQRLAKGKFKAYVDSFDYGNRDVSGTPDQDDGLLNSWLGTSLKISPEEQVQFLEKLCENGLPASKDAQEKTRAIMDRGEDWNGWKLFGKTGGGSGGDGWFVGWIEKEEERIFFAQYLNLKEPNLDLKGVTPQKSIGLAKEVAKAQLFPKY